MKIFHWAERQKQIAERKEKNKPNHITLLNEFANDNLIEGVTFNQAKQYLEDNGIKVNEPSVIAAIERTFGEIFINTYVDEVPFRKGSTKYRMTNESYYRMIQYRSYMESKESSLISNRFAIFAITIAFVSIIAQSILMGWQMAGDHYNGVDGKINSTSSLLQIKQYYENHPNEKFDAKIFDIK